MIGATGDDGLIRVTFQKRDDHLVADARDGHHAVLAAGPALAHPHPAGALVVGAAVSVPRKLQLHPAVLVAVDLFALGAHHDGDLRAVHHRLVGRQSAPGGRALHHRKGVVVDGRAAAPLLFQRLRLLAPMADLHHLPVDVERPVRVLA